MKRYAFILVLVGFLTVCSFAEMDSKTLKNKDTVLSNKTICAVYSLPASVWLEGVYTIGRPTAEFYAYMIFEGPYIAASAAVGVGQLKVGKDLLIGVAKEYIENPEKVCKNLSDALMSTGMESYRRNYSRYHSYKSTGSMSSLDFEEFLEDNHNVNYLGLGRDLFADIQSYKHKQGKYSQEKEFSTSWKGAKALLDEVDNLKGSVESPSTLGTLKDIVGVAQGNLASYPPYRDHLARVAKLEQKMDTEFPLAKKEEVVVEKATLDVKEEKFKLPVLKDHPDRPTMIIGQAIDLGNAHEVWANIYYKTVNLDGWLEMALIAEHGWRMDRMRELVEENSAEYRACLRNLISDGREIEIQAEKIYNLTKSPDYIVIVNLLIDKARVSEKNRALKDAVKCDNMEAINQLVLSGAEVSEEILLDAAVQMRPYRLTYLIKHAKKPNLDGLLLKVVSYEGLPIHYLTAQVLLEQGANVNCSDGKKTPLYYVIDRGKVNIRLVMLFLEHGAKVDASSMELAKKSDNKLLIRLLEGGLASNGTIEEAKKPVEEKLVVAEAVDASKVKPIRKEDIPDMNEFANKVFEATKSLDMEYFKRNSYTAEEFPLMIKLGYPVTSKVIEYKGYEKYKKDFEDYMVNLSVNMEKYFNSIKATWSDIPVSVDSGKLIFYDYDFENSFLFILADFYETKLEKTVHLEMGVRCEWTGESWKFGAIPVYFDNPKYFKNYILGKKVHFKGLMDLRNGKGLKSNEEELMVAKTLKTMKVLKEALDQFKSDTGAYPVVKGLNVLISLPEKNYLNSSTLPKDGWGRDLRFVFFTRRSSYGIISNGADGERGGEGYNADLEVYVDSDIHGR